MAKFSPVKPKHPQLMKQQNLIILGAIGPITYMDQKEFDKTLWEYWEQTKNVLGIDLGWVTHLDSAAISVIRRHAMASAAMKKQLCLISVPYYLLSLFESIGITKFCRIFDNRALVEQELLASSFNKNRTGGTA